MHRLALLLVLTSACVADGGDEGFNIVHNLAPTGNCEVTPGTGFLARGTIDKQSTSPYIFTPEIVSRIVAAEGSTEAQRTIVLRGAKIDVINAETGTSLKKFTSLFAASLSPLGTTTAAFDIIPTDVLASSGASGTTRVQLLAKITPYGALGGSGDNIDGVTFEYPVTVCDGCVANVLGACPLAFGTQVPESTPNGCNQFQDGMTFCCMSDAGPICPPTVIGEQFALTVTRSGANAATGTVTSTPTGINCGTLCTASFDSGTMVTLTANTAANWTGAPACGAASTTCTVTMTQAFTVDAEFP